ncbi:MAG: transglycosylase domain-containing protein [Alphaproteobacteria bacterium]|nr:transglycosylase domain-containing protein [Alphaproteobacteria bacterium]
MLTLWLENKLTKNHILSLYLNRVSLVGGKYGISIASETIFGKSVYDLNIAEAAILAGMLKAPSKLNPMKNLDASLNRMRVVLKLMYEQGYISKDEYETYSNYQYQKKSFTSNQTRYFVDYTMDNFNSIIGAVDTDVIVYTTLDNKVQKTAENVIKSYLNNDGEKYKFSQVASVILNNQGEILSMIGGSDYTQSQFNRVTQMKRQPGSIFKPFVYLAGVEYGLKPEDEFEDKLTSIGEWTPKNHDDKYLGTVTMAVALEKSLNTVPVQIARIIGLSNIVKTAHKLGLVDRLNNDYSIILGTSETTLLDLSSAYATFANKGYGVIPHSIRKITTSTGDIIYERKGSGVGRLISEENVNTMNSMLRSVIEGGTGANANIAGEMVFGKTGTSQNNRDAWFIGYTPNYTAGVWIGNDDNTPMSNASYGGTIPAKIFKTLMTYVIVR